MPSDNESASLEFNLEFPEKFQLHVCRVFSDATCLFSSTTRYYNVADHYAMVRPTMTGQFYKDLLDFESGTKKPLLQCLQECRSDMGSGTSWVMVLSKIPPLFTDWWAGQLGLLREMGVDLTIHVILLSDALPCSWEAVSHLRGSRLDASRLDAFRAKTIRFVPNVHTAIGSERGVFRVMKKVRAVSFTTGGLGSEVVVVSSLWQEQLLPSFKAPSRLVIDFAAEDALASRQGSAGLSRQGALQRRAQASGREDGVRGPVPGARAV